MNDGTKAQGYGNSRNRAPLLPEQHPNSKKKSNGDGGGGDKHADPAGTAGLPQSKDNNNNDRQQKRKDKKQSKRQLQLAAMKKRPMMKIGTLNSAKRNGMFLHVFRHRRNSLVGSTLASTMTSRWT
jgi:hypothetical protein